MNAFLLPSVLRASGVRRRGGALTSTRRARWSGTPVRVRSVRSAPTVRASASAPPPSPSAREKRLEAPDVRRLARLFWRLALPYWKRERSARRDLGVVVLLTVLQSGISVGFSYISRDFWTALNTKDMDLFMHQAALFFGALCVFTPLVVSYQYFRDRTALRWREWLTAQVLRQYVTNRNFYKLDQTSAGVDNPDQRIAQDLSSFTYESLALMLTVLVSCIDLAAFSAILLSIYPPLFGVLLAYAATGTALTTAVGRKLVGLNYAQLVMEADFRYSLIRFRDNAESVAFFGGETRERKEITRRLDGVVENLMRVIGLQRNLGFLQTGYRYLVQVLPALVVSPLYFSNQVPLGTVTQSFGAFSHILGDLSLIVNRFDSLSQFGAGIERLGEFVIALEQNLLQEERTFDTVTSSELSDADEAKSVLASGTPPSSNGVVSSNEVATNGVVSSGVVSNGAVSNGAVSNGVVSNGVASNGVASNGVVPSTEANESTPGSSITLRETETDGLVLRNVSLRTPSSIVKRVLIENLTLALEPGERLLVAGPSGVGKSSLLRAISGLWTDGSGGIERPSTSRVFFLPQRPYCTLGTLRANLLYPRDDDENAPSDADLQRVLESVELGKLPARMGGFDATRDWGDTLSLGEQQRLQFARLLLARPKMAVIDEGSAALSIEAEARMYKLLEEMRITVVSIGHRPSLIKYHDVLLRLSGDGAAWQVSQIAQEERDRVVAQVL